MKRRTLIAVCILFFAMGLKAQNITGTWYGTIQAQGISLRIVFYIEQADNQYVAKMDSPDQGVTGVPVDKTTFDFPNLHLKINQIQFEYSGEVNNVFSEIDGTMTQYGNEFPLRLQRETIEKQEIDRPQNPKRPYPYREEEVTFTNTYAGHQLAGTLTLPTQSGTYPVVVLISGSGAQNRNQELLGHQPFLVLSDYLTRQGIAVLRYDERGVGASGGEYQGATSADLAEDVEAAIAFLQKRSDIRTDQIGLIGHSEGGMIAPMVAKQNPQVDYIVLLAGPGIPIPKLLEIQQERIARAAGASDDFIKFEKKVHKKVKKILKRNLAEENARYKISRYISRRYDRLAKTDKERLGDKNTYIQGYLDQLFTPWFQYFFQYNPADALSKLQIPVLAINGAKDLQVTAVENIRGIEKALEKADNTQYTTRIFPDLNHLFQYCETGSPSEYATIEETFSEEVMRFIADWVLEQTR